MTQAQIIEFPYANDGDLEQITIALMEAGFKARYHLDAALQNGVQLDPAREYTAEVTCPYDEGRGKVTIRLSAPFDRRIAGTEPNKWVVLVDHSEGSQFAPVAVANTAEEVIVAALKVLGDKTSI